MNFCVKWYGPEVSGSAGVGAEKIYDRRRLGRMRNTYMNHLSSETLRLTLGTRHVYEGLHQGKKEALVAIPLIICRTPLGKVGWR